MHSNFASERLMTGRLVRMTCLDCFRGVQILDNSGPGSDGVHCSGEVESSSTIPPGRGAFQTERSRLCERFRGRMKFSLFVAGGFSSLQSPAVVASWGEWQPHHPRFTRRGSIMHKARATLLALAAAVVLAGS